MIFSRLQSGLPENELGSAEEVYQRSHQQSKRVQHRQHHPGAAAGEHRPRQVTELYWFAQGHRFVCNVRISEVCIKEIKMSHSRY